MSENIPQNSTLLLSTLNGLLNCSDKINTNFVNYDKSLTGLMAAYESLTGDIASLTGEQDAVTPTINYDLKPSITTLAGSGTHTLEDSKIYRSTLTGDISFILPDVDDEDVLHEIIITCKFTSSNYVNFYDAHSNVLNTMEENNYWSANDVVQYLCRYESLLGKWVIMMMRLH